MGITEEARREAIDKAMQAFAEPGSTEERVQLPYKDGREGPFPVLKVPTAAVLYNPRSHRIKSQLESHPKREIVADDPYSDEAQQVIHEILAGRDASGSGSDEFEALKANLGEYGQRDPGVVTRAGLLINANTRLAALRELDVDYIRAAILPSDADDHAIDRLELELQVQRDFKRDYTFTNELIFINELRVRHSYSEDKAAKALNWAASGDEKELKRGVERVRQSERLYALVRYVQSLGDGSIPLTFFDDKRQALIDLDDKYEAMKGSDPVGADQMKHARLLGILAGNFYRELRKIDGDAAVDNLLPALEEHETLGSELDALFASAPAEAPLDDDAALLGGTDLETDDQSPDLLPLVKLVATSHGKDHVLLPSGSSVDREGLVREIAESIDDAAEEVQATSKASRNVMGPTRQLEEAVKKAKAAAGGYREFRHAPGFDQGKFKYQFNKLKTQLAAIEKAITQHET
jgi:hypothetical protein